MSPVIKMHVVETDCLPTLFYMLLQKIVDYEVLNTNCQMTELFMN